MAVTKQNQQPAPSAMAQAMAEAMAQAQTQAQALAQAQAQDDLGAQIAEEKERAAILQEQLLHQMATQLAQQMVQQQQAPVPASVPTPALDGRLMAILAMCPFDTREEFRDWSKEILGCKPHEFVVNEASLELATSKARAYLVAMCKKNKELKNELLDKEVKEALWGVASPMEPVTIKPVVSPAVYRPSSSQPVVVSKPLFERPTRTYTPPQEVYIVRESQLRSSQNSEFWEDAVAVTAGLAVAGVVGYGIYKLVEHFMED